MKRWWLPVAVSLLVIGLSGLVYLRSASAHCDTMDGPVVKAAKQALQSGNVNYILPWVAEADEPQIRAAFAQARKVRKLSPEAKKLADNYFFETLVRIHRAGEGAPYTGLKPAGSEVNPAVAAADRAFESGAAEELSALLTEAVKAGVQARFAEAMEAQSKQVNDVAARRRGVHGYVEFVHYVEGIYNAAAMSGPHAAADAETAHH